MKDAASAGQQQNVAPNQQKAAQAAKQNQQSQAQSAQKQAELGLQMMLNSLREAEARGVDLRPAKHRRQCRRSRQ